jgi:hypothetical protein
MKIYNPLAKIKDERDGYAKGIPKEIAEYNFKFQVNC